MQRPQHQPILADDCTSLAHHFDGSSHSTDRNYWAAFEKHVTFYTRLGSFKTCNEFKNVYFKTDRYCMKPLFETFKNDIKDMTTFEENLIK